MMADPLMPSQVGTDIAKVIDLDWEHHWEHKLNIHWEDPLTECKGRMLR